MKQIQKPQRLYATSMSFQDPQVSHWKKILFESITSPWEVKLMRNFSSPWKPLHRILEESAESPLI